MASPNVTSITLHGVGGDRFENDSFFVMAGLVPVFPTQNLNRRTPMPWVAAELSIRRAVG
jgi:hypothetical protein